MKLKIKTSIFLYLIGFFGLFDCWEDITVGPIELDGSSFAFDETNKVGLVFGGKRTYNEEYYSYDTYFLDENLDFEKVEFDDESDIIPTGRSYSLMIEEPNQDRFILYGGQDGSNFGVILTDTWSFEINSKKWSYLQAETPFQLIALAYHPKKKRIIGIGDSGGEYSFLELNGNTWELSDIPSITIQNDNYLNNLYITYNSLVGELFVMAQIRYSDSDEDTATELDCRYRETIWECSTQDGYMPYNRPNVFLGYDENDSKIIRINTDKSLMEWDNTFENWETMGYLLPEDHAGIPTENIKFFDSDSIVYFYPSINDQASLYGYVSRSTEIWEISVSENNLIKSKTYHPASRRGIGIVLDPISKAHVTFGGGTDFVHFDGSAYNANLFNDTWHGTENEEGDILWTRATVEGPSARVGYAMEYDNSSQKIILHGGKNYDEYNYPQKLNDFWFYNVNSKTWIKLNKDASCNNLLPRAYHRMISLESSSSTQRKKIKKNLASSSEHKLYLVGGGDEDSIEGEEVYIWELDTSLVNSINTISCKPYSVSDSLGWLSSFGILKKNESSFYVYGGKYLESSVQDSMYLVEKDSITNHFNLTELTSLSGEAYGPGKLYGHEFVNYQGKALIIGGADVNGITQESSWYFNFDDEGIDTNWSQFSSSESTNRMNFGITRNTTQDLILFGGFTQEINSHYSPYYFREDTVRY